MTFFFRNFKFKSFVFVAIVFGELRMKGKEIRKPVLGSKNI